MVGHEDGIRLDGKCALAVPADVTDDAAVATVARRAVETFGRIDVWVNNAAVSMFARFEEAPLPAYRRVIETNLLGYVHGARAALPVFRDQGAGLLVNVSSMIGKAGMAYVSAYVASKFAIVGLSECLRQELLDAPDINVATVLPASIDTPLFQHAANYTGRAVKPLRPVYDAERVARAIVACAEDPPREVFAGTAGRMMAALHRVAPPLYERLTARQVERDHFQERPATPTDGNLFAPLPGWTGVSGDWRPPAGVSRGVTMAALGLPTRPGPMCCWRPGSPRRRSAELVRARALARIERERRKQRRSLLGCEVVRHDEIIRQHADDGVRRVVDEQRLSDRIDVAEDVFGHLVAEEDHAAALLLVRVRQVPLVVDVDQPEAGVGALDRVIAPEGQV